MTYIIYGYQKRKAGGMNLIFLRSPQEFQHNKLKNNSDSLFRIRREGSAIVEGNTMQVIKEILG